MNKKKSLEIDLYMILKNLWKIKNIVLTLFLIFFSLGVLFNTYQPKTVQLSYTLKKTDGFIRDIVAEKLELKVLKQFIDHQKKNYNTQIIKDDIKNHPNYKLLKTKNKNTKIDFKIEFNTELLKIYNIDQKYILEFQKIINDVLIENIRLNLDHIILEKKIEYTSKKKIVRGDLEIANLLNLEEDISVSVNDQNKNKGSVNVVMQGYHKGSKVLKKQIELIENDMNEEIKKFSQLKDFEWSYFYNNEIKLVSNVKLIKIFLVCFFLFSLSVLFFLLKNNGLKKFI